MKPQLTLGELISRLERCDPSVPVSFDFCGLVPTTFDSYRGYYNHLALGWKAEAHAVKATYHTVGALLALCRKADGQTFQGYKGGHYTMSPDTPLWVSNSGFADSTAIVDVLNQEYWVILETAYQP